MVLIYMIGIWYGVDVHGWYMVWCRIDTQYGTSLVHGLCTCYGTWLMVQVVVQFDAWYELVLG
jgi:hypothetical protein